MFMELVLMVRLKISQQDYLKIKEIQHLSYLVKKVTQ